MDLGAEGMGGESEVGMDLGGGGMDLEVGK